MAITPVIIALPSIVAVIRSSQFGEPIEDDLVIDATIVVAVICALAWCGLGLVRLRARLDRSPSSANDGVVVKDPDVIRVLLAQNDLACEECGYNLRGLPPGACPECHAPIRLRVSSTDSLRPLSRLVLLALVICGVRGGVSVVYLFPVLLRLPGFTFTGMPSSFRLRMWWFIAEQVLAVVGVIVLVIPVMRWIRSCGRPERTRARWRVAAWALGLLAVVTALDLITAMLDWL